ncbi:MAG TPA: flagellar basal body P-ring formation chaperone FlgA [Gemmatimonadaceae bacterium]|nr:flagellar basal body P-ring formation chaperone FlgA [Gemmatimonadaceae bacterium]
MRHGFRRPGVAAVLAPLAGLLALLAASAAGGQTPAASGGTLVHVAARPLPRGAVLRAEDIATRPALQSERAPADTLVPGPGWVTHRVVRQGERLRTPTVAPPPMVTRGTVVMVRWQHDGLSLTRTGISLGSADRGGRVVVRIDANRRIAGIATAPGVVEVP